MLAALMVGLLSGAPAANPLIGVWVLDGDRSAFVFDERRVVTVVDGECSSAVAYRYQLRDRGRVRVLMLGPDLYDRVTDFEIAGNVLRVKEGQRVAAKIFRRVSIAEVAKYPCIERELRAELPPASEADAILTDEGARKLAARLANDRAEHDHALRPFAATDYRLQFHEGRWIWGELDLSEGEVYSARVSFEVDGSRPLVRVEVHPERGGVFMRLPDESDAIIRDED